MRVTLTMAILAATSAADLQYSKESLFALLEYTGVGEDLFNSVLQNLDATQLAEVDRRRAPVVESYPCSVNERGDDDDADADGSQSNAAPEMCAKLSDTECEGSWWSDNGVCKWNLLTGTCEAHHIGEIVPAGDDDDDYDGNDSDEKDTNQHATGGQSDPSQGELDKKSGEPTKQDLEDEKHARPASADMSTWTMKQRQQYVLYVCGSVCKPYKGSMTDAEWEMELMRSASHYKFLLHKFLGMSDAQLPGTGELANIIRARQEALVRHFYDHVHLTQGKYNIVEEDMKNLIAHLFQNDSEGNHTEDENKLSAEDIASIDSLKADLAVVMDKMHKGLGRR